MSTCDIYNDPDVLHSQQHYMAYISYTYTNNLCNNLKIFT